MKKIFTVPVLLLVGFSQTTWSASNEANRLRGHWAGTYADERKTAEFRLTVQEDGSVFYRDNSALGPYCKGEVREETTSANLNVKFNCSTKSQRAAGDYTQNVGFTLTIKNPDRLSLTSERQSATIHSSIVGLEKVYLYKLANHSFSNVLNSPEGFEGSLIFPQYGTKNALFGNLHFELQENNQLIVTSGYLKSTKGHWSKVDYRNTFGDEGYLSGNYKIAGTKLMLKVKDDKGVLVSFTVDWANILNKNIYNYNVALPKHIKRESATNALIDGEKFKAGTTGPGFTAR